MGPAASVHRLKLWENEPSVSTKYDVVLVRRYGGDEAVGPGGQRGRTGPGLDLLVDGGHGDGETCRPPRARHAPPSSRRGMPASSCGWVTARVKATNRLTGAGDETDCRSSRRRFAATPLWSPWR